MLYSFEIIVNLSQVSVCYSCLKLVYVCISCYLKRNVVNAPSVQITIPITCILFHLTDWFLFCLAKVTVYFCSNYFKKIYYYIDDWMHLLSRSRLLCGVYLVRFYWWVWHSSRFKPEMGRVLDDEIKLLAVELQTVFPLK